MELKEIKREYEVLAKKYSLPNFKQLNEEFEVERINHESETVLRAVRKAVMEKMINMLGFLEMFINPVNVPRMYIPYIKSISAADKKEIDKIYDDVSALTMEGLDYEVDYSEEGEAKLIKKTFDMWNSVKPSLRKILANMRKPVADDSKKERSYYG
jgi:hypothetical protein